MSGPRDRRRRRWIAAWLATGLVAIGLQREAAITRAAPSATAFSTGAAVTILSTEDLRKFGIYFPDMPVGVIPAPGGGYTFFGAGSGAGGFGPGRDLEPPGTYKFTGNLDHIAPAEKGAAVLHPGLLPGRRQPSPDGRDFDRDYAAGGAVCAIRDRRWGDKPILLLFYHGEYHFPDRRRKVYGGLGAAISTNNGDSFVKLGQILGPYVSRDAFADSDVHGGIFTDGALTEADARGRPVAATAAADAVYDYVIFTDRPALHQRPVLAIARARKSDLLDAIARHQAPQFRRYYVPDTGSAGDFFTQPGIGGKFTPIVSQDNYLAHPAAIYDRYLKKFILSYLVDQRAVMLRTGDDLMHWSDPVTIVRLTGDPQLKIFYPSLVGADGDPAVLGKRFYLYYLQRVMYPVRGFAQPEFLRRTITAAP